MEERNNVFSKIVDCAQNGPLVIILSFLPIRELTTTIPLVSKAFSKTAELSEQRIEKGFTAEEYAEMLDLKKGINEFHFNRIVRSPKFKKSYIVKQNIKFELKSRIFTREIDCLSYCCYKNYISPIPFILKDKNVKFRNQHIAVVCKYGFLEILKLINEEDPYQRITKNHILIFSDNYPLFAAATSNQLNIVKYLLSFNKVQEEGLKRNILIHVASYGFLEVLKYLIDFFNDSITTIHPKALIFAIEGARKGKKRENCKDTAIFLIKDKRCDVCDEEGNAFHLSCQLGLFDIVKNLLEDQRIINNNLLMSKNNYGFRWACRNGHSKIVRFLLDNTSIDPNFPNHSPLIEAIKHDQFEIIHLLLITYKINCFVPITEGKDEKEERKYDDIDKVLEYASLYSSTKTLKLIFIDSKITNMLDVFDPCYYSDFALQGNNLTNVKFFLGLMK